MHRIRNLDASYYNSLQSAFKPVLDKKDSDKSQWNLSINSVTKQYDPISLSESSSFLVFQSYDLIKIVKFASKQFEDIIFAGVRVDSKERAEVFKIAKAVEKKLDAFDNEVASLNILSWIIFKVADWFLGYSSRSEAFRLDVRQLEAIQQGSANRNPGVGLPPVDAKMKKKGDKKARFPQDPVAELKEISVRNNGRKVGKLYS